VAWLDFRIEYIAWAIQRLSAFCIVLFMVQSMDRIVLCFGCFWIKLRGIKPRANVSASNTTTSHRRNDDDVESGDDKADGYYPMCNEKEVSPDTPLARANRYHE
jgi:xyloglucan glycosyltransferase 4